MFTLLFAILGLNHILRDIFCSLGARILTTYTTKLCLPFGKNGRWSTICISDEYAWFCLFYFLLAKSRGKTQKMVVNMKKRIHFSHQKTLLTLLNVPGCDLRQVSIIVTLHFQIEHLAFSCSRCCNEKVVQ